MSTSLGQSELPIVTNSIYADLASVFANRCDSDIVLLHDSQFETSVSVCNNGTVVA